MVRVASKSHFITLGLALLGLLVLGLMISFLVGAGGEAQIVEAQTSGEWVEAVGILNKGLSNCAMPWLTNFDGDRTWWIRGSELLADIPDGTAVALKGWLYGSSATFCQTSPIIDPTEVCLLPDSDVNADGWIDVVDLQLIAANWRAPNFNPRLDVNGDGVVDVLDLALVAADFGWNPCQVSPPATP